MKDNIVRILFSQYFRLIPGILGLVCFILSILGAREDYSWLIAGFVFVDAGLVLNILEKRKEKKK